MKMPETSFKDGDRVAPEDDALAALQNEVQQIRDDRNEERFLLIVVIIVLLNVLFFSIVENWAGALVIGLIELVGLAVLARRLGVEEVREIISKFLDRASERYVDKNRDTKSDH